MTAKNKKSIIVSDKELEFFDSSLKEAVKYANGLKANVKTEPLMIRAGKEEVKAARKVLKVSQPQFAKLVGYSAEAVKKWEQDKNPIPGGVVRWIEALRIAPKEAKKLLLSVNAKNS